MNVILIVQKIDSEIGKVVSKTKCKITIKIRRTYF